MKRINIGIIDYGAGNLRSVQKAFEKTGAKATISASPGELLACDGIVLPGVGAFEEGMMRLKERGLGAFVRSTVGKKPLLGICLGLQLLFEESAEVFSGKKAALGLGILKGKVVRFEGAGLKVPQVGWNQLEPGGESQLFQGIDAGEWAYFVHSYFAVPSDEAVVASRTTFGKTVFASAVEDGARKVFAAQFHPEKSGKTGLKVLENFVGICGKEK